MTQFKHEYDDSALFEIAKLMQELRPELSAQHIVDSIKRQQQNGYVLLSLWQKEEPIALAGYVISEKLGWGKHMYIDDLVVSESQRHSGIGQRLLRECKRICQFEGCESLHLDSGVQRFGAHRFYLANQFDITSHHFAMTV